MSVVAAAGPPGVVVPVTTKGFVTIPHGFAPLGSVVLSGSVMDAKHPKTDIAAGYWYPPDDVGYV